MKLTGSLTHFKQPIYSHNFTKLLTKVGEGKGKRNRGRNDGMGKGCLSTCKTDMCVQSAAIWLLHMTSVAVTWRQNLVEWIAEDLVFLACAIKFPDLLISWPFYFHFFQLQILSELAIYDTGFELLYLFVPVHGVVLVVKFQHFFFNVSCHAISKLLKFLINLSWT